MNVILRVARNLLLAVVASATTAFAQAYSPDAGPGRYRNPIIFADYSDPDAIRAAHLERVTDAGSVRESRLFATDTAISILFE
ncbi:MAG TPA: hypothetical protein VN706_07155 [Gemmatimonadaceae bacterium]|nr:hypothetical protein [Gemmatimonadaceae bacterium]